MSEPSPEVRRELEEILERDQSRAGQVYRLTRRGMSPPEIAEELGVASSNFVSNNRTIARGLLEGHVPSGPAAAQQVLSFVQRVARSRGLSLEARAYLDQQANRLSEATLSQARSSTGSRGQGRQQHAPPRVVPAASSLRDAVEEELRARVQELVSTIRESTDIEPVDYWAVATSPSPLDVIVRLVRAPGEHGTFKQLVDLKRIDLSLETAVVRWAQDLPLQRDLVEDAEAKKDWFSS